MQLATLGDLGIKWGIWETESNTHFLKRDGQVGRNGAKQLILCEIAG